MGKAQYAYLIGQIGSVCFYEVKNNVFLFGKSEYYWKYMSSADFYGPFGSLMAAMAHFDHIMRTPASIPPTNHIPADKVMLQPVTNNVIRVDFKNKRRI